MVGIRGVYGVLIWYTGLYTAVHGRYTDTLVWYTGLYTGVYKKVVSVNGRYLSGTNRYSIHRQGADKQVG